MEKKIHTILLEKYRVAGSKVFTGRDRGEFVRKDSKIDALISDYDNIKIVIPDDIYNINPSFLEEFLINVVLKLGKDKFLQNILFVNNGEYKIDKALNESIERILRQNNALV